MRLANALRALVLSVAVVAAGAPLRADMILQQYEFGSQIGTETSVAPTTSVEAAGLTGMNFAESAVLTPTTGAGSINSSGWTLAGASYSFGFTVAAGLSVTVDQLILTSRSSGTGPGFLNVMASVDGGTAKTVGTITQSGTNYNDEFLAISPVTALHSLVFTMVVANQTSAAGGTLGSGGTFRVGDYDPTGATSATPFTINGTIAPAAGGGGTAAVPEPASVALLGLGLVGGVVVARRRRADR